MLFIVFLQLIQDFITQHENHKNLFIENWPTVAESVIKFAVSKPKNQTDIHKFLQKYKNVLDSGQNTFFKN